MTTGDSVTRETDQHLGQPLPAILFVDDEEHVLRSLERSFIDRPFQVFFASSAEEALDLVSRQMVAVVVADNTMPGMKGVDFLERLRMMSPDTVRILLTANVDFGTAISAINQGEVFRFIAKPWNDDELHRVVDDSVERHRLIIGMRSGDEACFRALAKAVELKAPYTRGHCDRVAHFASLLGARVGLDGDSLRYLRHGCILHNCGKIGVPESINTYPGRLSPSDFQIVTHHPVWGLRLPGRRSCIPWCRT
ncbi:MAG: hypothetical protein Fur0034_16320 [Desulfuromonadia bacterium]